MKTLSIFAIVLLISLCHSLLYSDLKDDLLSFLRRSADSVSFANKPNLRTKFRNKKDAENAHVKAKVVERARKNEIALNGGVPVPKFLGQKSWKESYHMDPVLNMVKRRSRKSSDSSSLSSSSSMEMMDWQDEWKQMWMKKKFEALNATGTGPRGDFVNMVAARPWGVPCGDPNQHDMPWGSCMLAAECEAEFRIYRGDYFCGRTQFVCCAIQLNTYDMYQGFDVSFASSSLDTDSTEIRDRNRGSKENRKRKRKRERRRRKRAREKRKRKMKRLIRKIVREIRKILNRSYKNGTTQRRKKTKALKKFIKKLKKQYRQDRNSVFEIHDLELIKIDSALYKKLNQIREVNKEFMRNETFREAVMNGTMTKSAARMLVQAYPELSSYIDVSLTRRSGGSEPRKDYLDYDIEYGMLYY